MTIDSEFPLGYFYIVSKLNNLVLDLDTSNPIAAGTPVVTAEKKEVRPDRDTQLWIHQDGFLTNKSSGLVLDVGTSKSFMAIFTGEPQIYIHSMKEEEQARDQRFGYSSSGYLYPLFEPEQVVDIRKKKMGPGATIMIYQKNKNVEEGLNQIWTLELADPPKVIDSDEEDEASDSKSARLRAWFGSWGGWNKNAKDKVLQEKELKQAHKKVYQKKKSHLSYEVIAGAVAVEAVKLYMEHQEAQGEDIHFKGAKEAIAGIAAAEMVKMFMERGTDDDEEDADEESKQKKQSMLQGMAVSAATNYFESKF